MEINALIGELMIKISKNVDNKNKEYQKFLQELIKIVDCYQVGKDNTNLITRLKSLQEGIKEVETSRKEIGSDEKQSASIESHSKNETQYITILDPIEEGTYQENKPDELLEQSIEQEEKIDCKGVNWGAFVYTDREGLGGRVGNSKIQRDSRINSMLDADCHELKRNIYRDGDKYFILFSYDELSNLILSRNACRGECHSIAFMVEQDDLPYLKLSEDMKLSLEDGNDLVGGIRRNGESYREERKVLIPFSNKTQEVEKTEVDFANVLFEFACLLSKDRNYQIEMVSGGRSLNMQESIQLANIFSKTPYSFAIENFKKDGSGRCLWEKNKFTYRTEKNVNIITASDNTIDPERVLILDIKDGFCSERNIDALEKFTRTCYDYQNSVRELQWCKEQREMYKGNPGFLKIRGVETTEKRGQKELAKFDEIREKIQEIREKKHKKTAATSLKGRVEEGLKAGITAAEVREMGALESRNKDGEITHEE